MALPRGPSAVGWRKFVALQFGLVWAAARADQGVSPGEAIQAGVSHADFGKKWPGLEQPVKDYILMLHLYRAEHFAEMAKSGDLDKLLKVGRGEATLDPALQLTIAQRLHIDWMDVRRALYSCGSDEERAVVIAAGLKPYGDHEGDKVWELLTEAQQNNDLVMVPKLAALFAYCEDGGDAELKEFMVSLRA